MPTSGGTPALQNVQPRRKCAIVAKAVQGRRHHHRQDQHARTGVRHHQHQPVVVRRPGEKSLRQDPDSRRLLGRNGGGDRRRHRHLRPRNGHRRFDPHSRSADRHRRACGRRSAMAARNGATRIANMVVPISHTRDTVGPMGRTVADVALLDSVITGTPMATAEPLRGKRFGIPAAFWGGLDRDVEDVMKAARAETGRRRRRSCRCRYARAVRTERKGLLPGRAA